MGSYTYFGIKEAECSAGTQPRPLEYKGSELDMLDLAWATTVHKAQGSEARVVIQVMTPASRRLASRRLLYTGEWGMALMVMHGNTAGCTHAKQCTINLYTGVIQTRLIPQDVSVAGAALPCLRAVAAQFRAAGSHTLIWMGASPCWRAMSALSALAGSGAHQLLDPRGQIMDQLVAALKRAVPCAHPCLRTPHADALVAQPSPGPRSWWS